jgi:hypothetical protein
MAIKEEGLQIKLSMAGFVDDTKGQTNDMREKTPLPSATLLARMQDNAQLWGDLLHVSGGALEIPKCNYYYIMQWCFNDQGDPILDKTVQTKMHLKSGKACYKATGHPNGKTPIGARTIPLLRGHPRTSLNNTNMDRRQAQLIQKIWASMIALWKIRNDNRHGCNKETKELARHKVLANELKPLYLRRDQYPVVVRNLLQSSFHAHCEDTSSQIEDWLHAYRVTFQVMHI